MYTVNFRRPKDFSTLSSLTIVSVGIDVLLALISGPFLKNYLLVVDYNQQNIYQLKPESGEVRAIPMRPCHPVSVVFDPYINGVYVICFQSSDSLYHIRKKTFDGRIDKNIYYVPQSTFVLYCVEIITT